MPAKSIPVTPEQRAGHPEPLIYYLHAATLAHTQAMAFAGGTAQASSFASLDPELKRLLSETDFWNTADASTARLGHMLSGIEKWRNHPYQRQSCKRPVIWEGHGATLKDFATGKSGPRILVMPSLINKANILDLTPDTTFLGYLAENGLRPALIDWGNAAQDPQINSIDDYMEKIIMPAFEHLASESNDPPNVLGYCIGGTLAIGLASQRPSEIAKLALIGAPWNFQDLKGVSLALKTYAERTGLMTLRHKLDSLGHVFGAVPASLFQHLFAILSPMQALQKFARFDQIDQRSNAAEIFVAVEDWLAEGVPVSVEAAKTILVDWYIENKTASGDWNLLGTPVEPKHLTCKTMIIAGRKDHIVPPALSKPLLSEVQNASFCDVDMGHVGMVLGRNSKKFVGKPLIKFFSS